MKAAVITGFGETPQYADFPDPVISGNEQFIHVKAAVLENFDKGASSGKHYSSKTLFPKFPAIVGNDGVGITENGELVAFGKIRPPYGAFAEKVSAGYTIPVPSGIDPADAAAILPSALTSLLPLKHAAKLLPGETVFVNGATGVSGRIAVQIAKILGAKKIVAAGRNDASLQLLKTLGADETISLLQSDEKLAENLIAAGGDEGYDIVIDFLWGHPAEILINTFIPKQAGFAKHRIRYIQVGEKAGSHLSIPGSAFRTSGLEMMGVGKIAGEVLTEEINLVWNLIQEKKLYMDIEKVPLKNISEAWQRTGLAGKRLVIVP
ncbi:quinone oxidoreductase family protein [Parafilimonas terrae]|uniref:NADPH2:quinone reductase n=1 Tax=Parafilimonas terrae TaxID=1465490 RepID=A0A1I5RJD3_9BACT|nr:zinc-binding alcohol dehydrogenase family protein [Parafilimonas terrae]SFP58645.1 NADPH2:quinone reductase [Parafilimonas terrae]